MADNEVVQTVAEVHNEPMLDDWGISINELAMPINNQGNNDDDSEIDAYISSYQIELGEVIMGENQP